MVRIAGGEELFAGEGSPSARLSWDEVFEAAPEVLVLMPCGFDAARTVEEARALPDHAGWSDLPAVREGRVWAVDANSYFSRPVPRLVEGVELLVHILLPEVLPGAPVDGNTVRMELSRVRVGKTRIGGAADRRRDARLT
jgi:iron complex transport system substrate-binding protein